MKYILHYVNRMNRGGMEQYIMNMYRGLNKDEYQFHFAVHSTQKSDFDEEIIEMGGKIIVFPKYQENPIEYYRKWDLFWKENVNTYDVFHYHNNFLGNIISMKTAIKNNFNNILIHAHSSFARKNIFKQIIHKKNQKWVNQQKITRVAVSEEAAMWVFGSHNQQDVSILNNGIKYADYRFNRNTRNILRKKHDIENEFILGHVGNFNAVKNHEFIVQVFNELVKDKPSSKLIFIGNGSLLEEIQITVNKLKLEEKVIFLGNISNVNEYLNMMDFFIFPSKYEGLGLAIIEAQINGIPSIYSNTVPSTIEISNLAVGMSLSLSAKEWAKEIIKNSNKRQDNTVLDNKFDIGYALSTLKDKYNSFN